MGQSAKIRPEQIAQAKKLLQDLPEKEDRKTRSEAAKILEKDFRLYRSEHHSGAAAYWRSAQAQF